MYLSYEEFEEMGGTLEETTFNSICFEAQSRIDWVTFNRLKNETTQSEAVKKCIFEIIKLVQTKRLITSPNLAEDTQGVHRMSNDGVEITYNTVKLNELLPSDLREIENMIKMYLNGVKNSKNQLVLYRGRYENE